MSFCPGTFRSSETHIRQLIVLTWTRGQSVVTAMVSAHRRLSTRDQNPDAQRDALTAVGCDQIFLAKASGKLARRPGLDKALLSASRAGDQLVVTKLDRSVAPWST